MRRIDESGSGSGSGRVHSVAPSKPAEANLRASLEGFAARGQGGPNVAPGPPREARSPMSGAQDAAPSVVVGTGDALVDGHGGQQAGVDVSRLWIGYAVERRSMGIVGRLAMRARAAGVVTETADLASRPLPPADAEVAILIASISSGHHEHCTRVFVREHRAWLAKRRTACFSTRGIGGPPRPDLRGTPEEDLESFLATCGWTPDVALVIPGARDGSGLLGRRLREVLARPRADRRATAVRLERALEQLFRPEPTGAAAAIPPGTGVWTPASSP